MKCISTSPHCLSPPPVSLAWEVAIITLRIAVLKLLSQANYGKRVCYGDHLNILPRALKVQETYRGAMPLLKISLALHSAHGCR